MADKQPWWRGTRGEWYVVVQFALLGLLVFGPAGRGLWHLQPGALSTVARVLAAALVVAGGGLVLAGLGSLGRNLAVVPLPRSDGELVQSGAYRLVRHPIYSGIILGALGWALWFDGVLTLLVVVALFVLFDLKSRREEQWLTERYPAYAAYRQRVRKLIPFVY